MMFDINPDTENVVSAVYKTLSRSIVPALESCSGWGDINPPNPKSETYIRYYKTKVMLFMDYLQSEFFICVIVLSQALHLSINSILKK